MISNIQITSSGIKVQETSSYLVTTLFGHKIDFTFDACMDDQYISVILMGATEDKLNKLFNNLSRAYRNKYIGIVHINYEVGEDANNMKEISIDIDGTETEVIV